MALSESSIHPHSVYSHWQNYSTRKSARWWWMKSDHSIRALNPRPSWGLTTMPPVFFQGQEQSLKDLTRIVSRKTFFHSWKLGWTFSCHFCQLGFSFDQQEEFSSESLVFIIMEQKREKKSLQLIETVQSRR